MVYPISTSTPTELLSVLPEKFEVARQCGQLLFFNSKARDVYSEGKRFNLRCCPALLDKAKAKTEALAAVRNGDTQSSKSGTGSPEAKRQRISPQENGDAEAGTAEGQGKKTTEQNKAEPFKPPYVDELYVGCLEGLEGEEGMSILLNKYSLLPEHILLCPPTYQPQSLPPTPPQLALAHSILMAAQRHPTRPRKLLGFYNGGEGAGASQTWRHLQFVEIENGRAPVEEWVQDLRFDRMDEPRIVPSVPYLHIVHPLPPASSLPFPPTPESTSNVINTLAPAMMKMLDLAFDALRVGGGRRDGGWNLLITLDHLHLIPRSAPSFPLPEPHQPLELNSLGYAGMMLVRSAEEEQALLSAVAGKNGGLMSVLQQCGVPREWGEKAIEATERMHGRQETW